MTDIRIVISIFKIKVTKLYCLLRNISSKKVLLFINLKYILLQSLTFISLMCGELNITSDRISVLHAQRHLNVFFAKYQSQENGQMTVHLNDRPFFPSWTVHFQQLTSYNFSLPTFLSVCLL